jgi:hypothetical protein
MTIKKTSKAAKRGTQKAARKKPSAEKTSGGKKRVARKATTPGDILEGKRLISRDEFVEMLVTDPTGGLFIELDLLNQEQLKALGDFLAEVLLPFKATGSGTGSP